MCVREAHRPSPPAVSRWAARFAWRGAAAAQRGVSDSGKVANDVELEQIVHEEGVSEGTFSSFLQMRGSIPTFWTQETSVTMPKPPIVLNRVDPTYAASQQHFADLLEVGDDVFAHGSGLL